MTTQKEEIDNKFNKYSIVNTELLKHLERYIISYFKKSFILKSFNGKKWKSGADLVDSGNLKNSFYGIISKNGVTIYNNAKYAGIHNFGGRIRITNKMRKFFWSKYYSTNDNKWKYMAITDKKYITIPQRQFMGITRELKTNIKKEIIKHITR